MSLPSQLIALVVRVVVVVADCKFLVLLPCLVNIYIIPSNNAQKYFVCCNWLHYYKPIWKRLNAKKKEQSTNEKNPTTTSEIEQRNKKPTIKVELCIGHADRSYSALDPSSSSWPIFSLFSTALDSSSSTLGVASKLSLSP